MKQFTVYAGDGENGGACAVYMVNFTERGVIACPLREGWKGACERVELGINGKYFDGARPDPFRRRPGCRR